MNITRLLLVFFALALIAVPGRALAEDGLEGWGPDSEFDEKYDIFEYDRVKGYFQEFFEMTPMEGMAPGLAMKMRDRADDEVVTVILGPKSFLGDAMDRFDIRSGQKVKAYGAWARINGEDVMIATKLKRTEDHYFKFRRTDDGLAYWNMPPAEFAEENSREEGNVLQ